MFVYAEANNLQTSAIYSCWRKGTDFKCWTIICHFPWLCTQLFLWHLSHWMKTFDTHHTFVTPEYSCWNSPALKRIKFHWEIPWDQLIPLVLSLQVQASLGHHQKGTLLSFQYEDAGHLSFHGKEVKWNCVFCSNHFFYIFSILLWENSLVSLQFSGTFNRPRGIACCDYFVWICPPTKAIIFFEGWFICAYLTSLAFTTFGILKVIHTCFYEQRNAILTNT